MSAKNCQQTHQIWEGFFSDSLYTALANQTAHLLVVAVPALDLALAAALEVLLHLDLHADLVALVRVQRTPS